MVLSVTKITSSRNIVIEVMEKQLPSWINDEGKYNMPLKLSNYNGKSTNNFLSHLR